MSLRLRITQIAKRQNDYKKMQKDFFRNSYLKRKFSSIPENEKKEIRKDLDKNLEKKNIYESDFLPKLSKDNKLEKKFTKIKKSDSNKFVRRGKRRKSIMDYQIEFKNYNNILDYTQNLKNKKEGKIFCKRSNKKKKSIFDQNNVHVFFDLENQKKKKVENDFLFENKNFNEEFENGNKFQNKEIDLIRKNKEQNKKRRKIKNDKIFIEDKKKIKKNIKIKNLSESSEKFESDFEIEEFERQKKQLKMKFIMKNIKENYNSILTITSEEEELRNIKVKKKKDKNNNFEINDYKKKI